MKRLFCPEIADMASPELLVRLRTAAIAKACILLTNYSCVGLLN
jgi:hypothetical protein